MRKALFLLAVTLPLLVNAQRQETLLEKGWKFVNHEVTDAWQTDYNDPVPGETFEYPEFKGYIANVKWMQIETTEGKIGIKPTLPRTSSSIFVGVYQPRDGRDHILYDLPQTGISLLDVIPAVRNKVNTTDLNGPSAQPYWAKGLRTISALLWFE